MRVYLFYLFFKQKTAYEMRFSDWSSDVCSSDLGRRHRDEADRGDGDAGDRQSPGKRAERQQPCVRPLPAPKPIEAEERKPEEQSQIAKIGRASCKVRVWK